MKEKYLEELKELLSEYSIKQDELEDILADYDEMIEDAKSKNMSDEGIIKMIGSPEQVVKDLSEELERGEEYIYYHKGGSKGRKHDNRIVASMPFISVIIYFVLGFGFNLWHPGWLIFLSIPMVAIIVNAFDRNRMNGLVALSPFIAVITYLVLGFFANLWHPGWLVFMIIPIMGILSGRKTMRLLSFFTAVSPFVVLIAYVLIGTYAGLWNPYWLLFMIIPMLGILHETKVWKVLVMELSFIIAIAGYLVSGYIYDEWVLGLFSFLIPLGVSILVSDDSFLVLNFKIKGDNKTVWLLTLALGVIYIGLGLLVPSTWVYLWMIFLLIPVYAIVKFSPKKDRLIAVMPFVSLIIFFTLGFFFNWWKFSWIAFLLIPMVAILKDNEN